ncbi:hypothetical protein FCV25MIE_29094 [Fagus crenata]
MGGDYVKIFGKIFQNNVLVDDPMKKSASTPTLSSLNNDNEVVADSGYLSDCIGTVQRKAVRERKKDEITAPKDSFVSNTNKGDVEKSLEVIKSIHPTSPYLPYLPYCLPTRTQELQRQPH